MGLGRGRKTVASCLQSLVPDRVSVFLPDKELDAVGGLVSEDENVSRERVAPESFPDHGRQTVERFSKIDRLGREPDADGRGQAQHEAPPASRRSTSVTSVWGSKPGPTRRQRPLARTISISRVTGGLASSVTTCTGRKAGFSWAACSSFRRHT